MKYKFNSKSHEILVALQQVVWRPMEDEDSIQLISKFYGLDADLIKAERNIIRNVEFPNDPIPSNISDLLCWFERHDILTFFPLFKILAAIPVTSYSAERNFSSLHQILTCLRSTMGEERLSNIAVIQGDSIPNG